MDINDNDLTPAGGGELHGPTAPSISKLAGTFTPTQIVHPDDIWSPRSREVGNQDTGSRFDPYQRAESERPTAAVHMGESPIVGGLVRDPSRSVRTALRGGYAG